MKEKEVSLVKVKRKGQVAIPHKTRERRWIREGDYLVATEVDGQVVLRKFSLPNWDELFAYGGKNFVTEENITREDVLTAIGAVRRGT